MRAPDFPKPALAARIETLMSELPEAPASVLRGNVVIVPSAVVPSPPSSVAEPARGAHRRQKIWQLAEKLHCPVLGACLPMPALRKLATRFEFSAALDDDYALHVEAVGRSHERTPFTVALQHLLDATHADVLRRFERAGSPDAVYALWRDAGGQGHVAGALWAAVTHPRADIDLQARLSADIHMLSHQISAGLAADTRQRRALNETLADVRQQLAAQQQDAAARERAWQERTHSLESAARERELLRVECDELRQRLVGYEAGSVVVDLGRKVMQLTVANEQLLAAAERTRDLELALREAQAACGRLADECKAISAERDALEALFLTPPCAQECAACPAGDVAPPGMKGGRRILCVGGRTQLVGEYRKLAERLGIRLVHHDGGVEESLSRLPDMINGADVVICPTDCVSHPAYYRIKNQCKRQGKPFLMFKGGGVSSVAAALVRVSADSLSTGRPHDT